MNILYVHGFKSQFKEQSDKVRALNKIGKVYGVTLDYTNTFCEIKSVLHKVVLEKSIDLIVGTSLGGFYSAILGASAGIPFVAINPAIDPIMTLNKYIGDGVTFSGEAYTLKEEIILDYPDFPLDGCGFILLDLGDDLINAKQTRTALEKAYRMKVFNGGSHRFMHINESLDEIKGFFETSSFVYGFGADDD